MDIKTTVSIYTPKERADNHPYREHFRVTEAIELLETYLNDNPVADNRWKCYTYDMPGRLKSSLGTTDIFSEISRTYEYAGWSIAYGTFPRFEHSGGFDIFLIVVPTGAKAPTYATNAS